MVCAVTAGIIIISHKVTQPQNLPKLPKALFSIHLSQLKMLSFILNSMDINFIGVNSMFC